MRYLIILILGGCGVAPKVRAAEDGTALRCKLRPAIYPPYPQRLNDYADFYFALRGPNGTQFALTPHTVFN